MTLAAGIARRTEREFQELTLDRDRWRDQALELERALQATTEKLRDALDRAAALKASFR